MEPKDYPALIRRNIQAYRAWRKLTYPQIADAMGCTVSLVQSILTYQTAFKASTLALLAKVYETNPANFWKESPDDLPPAYYLNIPNLEKDNETDTKRF